MIYKPGTLVNLRERDWIVMPSPDPDVLRIKPLGGHEAEATGIYLPLALPADRPKPTTFPKPSPDDLADFESAQLLYDAARLALRTGAGPFRSFGRLSVRPRAYQLVPLIMALKQEVVRLLIADDVGIGKTIEALLVVREMYDRGLIERFAVVCPPHLCVQWQNELREKFGFEAEIIRSDTAAGLDRRIQGDDTVFRFYPFQVISIDYIKAETRRELFLSECPELVIVDEAHTCAKPAGAIVKQQQRHHLLHRITERPNQHLMLLTATPHSGIETSFQSLLGLIRPEFEQVEVSKADQATRRRLANHFVQRRRKDIEHWIEDTDFPERESLEIDYPLSATYQIAFDQILKFAQEFVQEPETNQHRARLRYWTALGLLRGVISSPKAGAQMLRNRLKKLNGDEADSPDAEAETQSEAAGDTMTDVESDPTDYLPTHLRDLVDIKDREARQLNRFADQLDDLATLDLDLKAKTLLDQLRGFLDEGLQPIVFCRYIQTANYLAEVLAPELETAYKGIAVEAVTSELNDDQRKERVAELGKASKRVLVATDCLSEGINLQEHFTAVVHYDLPWNPNRIEQREGRVDRYGQPAKKVKTLFLLGLNPIDGVIVQVLLRKTKKIREETGISIPFPEDSKTITEAITQAVLLNPNAAAQASRQLSFDFDIDVVKARESDVERALERAKDRELGVRSIFAQYRLKPEDIEPDLRETDKALGSAGTVERFARRAMAHLGVQMDALKKPHCFRLYPSNLPAPLQDILPEGNELKITFQSPVPDGYYYLGRNHAFVEQTCQHLMQRAFGDPTGQQAEHLSEEVVPRPVGSGRSERSARPARAAVILTDQVSTKTVLALFRVRNVVREKRRNREIVAEEVLSWGYRGFIDEEQWLTPAEAQTLLLEALPSSNMSPVEQAERLNDELADWQEAESLFESITRERTDALIAAHGRYQQAVGGASYEALEPVLPPDILGIYVLVPDLSG